MAPSSYLAAAEVGVDMLDTAFSAFGWGTSQPPTESIVALLRGTPYDSGLDLELLYEIGEYFAGISAKYRMLFTAEATRPNVNVLLHQIPGGMLSNLVSQLREQNALERKGEVLSEIPKVRKDFGYPPLVTPTSQLVGTQAVLNVLDGVRYKQVTQEVRDYFLGKYGRPPAQLDEEVKKLIVGDERPINGRPADLLEPGLDKARDDAHKFGIMSREEDLLTYALYPRIAVRFLKGEMKEEAMPSPITSSPTNSQLDILPNEFNVDVDGEVFNVKVSSVIGKTFEVEKPKQVKEIPIGAVISSMQGMVLSLNVKVGDTVKVDDALFSIEAMKMQNEIKSPHAGTVKEVLIYEGEVINAGDVLMVIES
jgi:pyruvate carboxylase subunit B